MREKREEVAAIAELLLLKETITHDDIVDAIGHRPFTVRDFLPAYCTSRTAIFLLLKFASFARFLPPFPFLPIACAAGRSVLTIHQQCSRRKGAEGERSSGERKQGY